MAFNRKFISEKLSDSNEIAYIKQKSNCTNVIRRTEIQFGTLAGI